MHLVVEQHDVGTAGQLPAGLGARRHGPDDEPRAGARRQNHRRAVGALDVELELRDRELGGPLEHGGEPRAWGRSPGYRAVALKVVPARAAAATLGQRELLPPDLLATLLDDQGDRSVACASAGDV